jgi:hypothetical protein
MTSEHDRLLAKGPRDAPEPRTVGGAADSGPLPVLPQPASTPRSPVLPGTPTRWPFGRLAVPILFAAFVAVQALRSHSAGAVGFAVVWAVVLVAAFARRMRRS